jgi:hypothetical protein
MTELDSSMMLQSRHPRVPQHMGELSHQQTDIYKAWRHVPSCLYHVNKVGTVRHMQAGKTDKQPPTHATGDTAHADSTAYHVTQRNAGFEITRASNSCTAWNLLSCHYIRPAYKTGQQDQVLWAPARDKPPAAVITLPSGHYRRSRSACMRSLRGRRKGRCP